jgi:hypothetical protein
VPPLSVDQKVALPPHPRVMPYIHMYAISYAFL